MNDINYVVLPTEPLSRQLVERIRSLERQLAETRDALKAAEERENVLILDRLRTEGGL
jgi:phage shock protein A